MNSHSSDSLSSQGFRQGTVDPRLKFGIELSATGQRPSTISNLMLRETDDRARWAVADVSYRTSGDLQSARRIQQTVVYCEHPSWNFPAVSVRGRSVASTLFAAMGSLTGLREVSLSTASFPDSLIARSLQPRCAAELFSDEVCQTLESCPFPLSELVVLIGTKRIAIFRSEQILEETERGELAAFAHHLCAALSQQADGLDDYAARAIAEAKETYQSIGGPLQALAAKRPTQDSIDEFLKQDIPRQAPGVIRSQLYSNGSLLVYVVAVVLCGIGAALFAMLQSDLPGWGLWLLGLLPAAGVLSAILAWRFRSARKRMLSRGECVEAKVTHLQATNAEINGERRYLVTLSFAAEERPDVTVSAYAQAIEKAFDLWASETPTRVLVDPQNHQRVFWIDGEAVW